MSSNPTNPTQTQHSRLSKLKHPSLIVAALAAITLAAVAPNALADRRGRSGGRSGSNVSFGLSIGSGGHRGGHSSFHLGVNSGRHYNNHYSNRHRSTVIYNRPVVYTPAYRRPIVRRYPAPITYSYISPSYSYSTYSYRPNTAYVYQPPVTTNVYQSTNVYSTPAAAPVYGYADTTPAPAPTPIEDGWSKLSNSMYDASTALNTFASEAERFPNAALPKVGYALSQGLLLNDEKAVWAMRRAVNTDAEALRHVPLNDPIRAKVRELADRYDKRVREGFTRSDDLFMIAALRTIEGQYAVAHSAINAAAQAGDRDEATTKLQNLINDLYSPQTEQ